MNGAHWRTSSRSGSNGGDCVEVAETVAAIGVRDSKDRDGGVLVFDRLAWQAFLADVKAGALDH